MLHREKRRPSGGVVVEGRGRRRVAGTRDVARRPPACPPCRRAARPSRSRCRAAPRTGRRPRRRRAGRGGTSAGGTGAGRGRAGRRSRRRAVSSTCPRMSLIAARTRFSPAAASLARVGSRSGPKMNSAARATTRISPQPIESNTQPPSSVQRVAPPSVSPTRVPAQAVASVACTVCRRPVADHLEGDRVPRLVRVDGRPAAPRSCRPACRPPR